MVVLNFLLTERSYVWLRIKYDTTFKLKNKMNKENKTSDKQQNGNDFTTDDISRLSDRLDDIAKNADTDVNRTLFRIVGHRIELYEIDLNEEKVKSFLGSFNINDL